MLVVVRLLLLLEVVELPVELLVVCVVCVVVLLPVVLLVMLVTVAVELELVFVVSVPQQWTMWSLLLLPYCWLQYYWCYWNWLLCWSRWMSS